MGNYFESLWNWCKIISVVAFWMGFFENIYEMREYHATGGVARGGACIEGAGVASCPAGDALDVATASTHFGDTWYSISLFFMWLRVLHLISVNKDLGPLVVVIGRMGRDMLTFGVIWGVLLLAFSSAVHGTGLENTPEVEEACNALMAGGAAAAGRGDSFVRMRCWSGWWILRTYYQAFGQPFFEDLTTDASNMITIIMWPVMNLMLVNLLIAIMNDTYAEVKNHSKLEWMVAMLHLAKEYRSPSRLNAVMLVYDIMMFIARKSEIDARLSKLVGDQKPKTLWAWVDDCRFKFKKFQCGDIPSVAVSDQRKALELLLLELEEEEAIALGRPRRHNTSPTLSRNGSEDSLPSLANSGVQTSLARAPSMEGGQTSPSRSGEASGTLTPEVGEHVGGVGGNIAMIANLKLRMGRLKEATQENLQERKEKDAAAAAAIAPLLRSDRLRSWRCSLSSMSARYTR